MNRRFIAREWLIFLIFLCIGLIIMPILISLIVGITEESMDRIDIIFGIYLTLIGLDYKGDMIIVWFFVLLPYIFSLFIRSIMWSIKTFRKKD